MSSRYRSRHTRRPKTTDRQTDEQAQQGAGMRPDCRRRRSEVGAHQGVWVSRTRERAKRSPAQPAIQPACVAGVAATADPCPFSTSARPVGGGGPWLHKVPLAGGQANESDGSFCLMRCAINRPRGRGVVAEGRTANPASNCTALVLHCMKELHRANSSNRSGGERAGPGRGKVKGGSCGNRRRKYRTISIRKIAR